jgi:hypothetical protein
MWRLLFKIHRTTLPCTTCQTWFLESLCWSRQCIMNREYLKLMALNHANQLSAFVQCNWWVCCGDVLNPSGSKLRSFNWRTAGHPSLAPSVRRPPGTQALRRRATSIRRVGRTRRVIDVIITGACWFGSCFRCTSRRSRMIYRFRDGLQEFMPST